MKRIKSLLLLSFLSLPVMAQETVYDEGPTMGWSSWNTYGLNINEDLIRKQAVAMVGKGLKGVGFQYINIDEETGQ